MGPDGKVTLQASAAGALPRRRPVLAGAVERNLARPPGRRGRSGLQRRDDRGARVYSLSVVVAGEPDAQLNLQMIGGSGEERWSRAKVGPDGTATFEGLVAGTYRLMLYGGKGGRQRSMKVTVPAAGAVTFKEDVETALVVRALDSDGYLASAGLQAGDVITGADGTDFDGSRPASQVLSGLLSARKDLKLRFVRSGKSSEATVDSEKFLAATNHLRALEAGGEVRKKRSAGETARAPFVALTTRSRNRVGSPQASASTGCWIPAGARGRPRRHSGRTGSRGLRTVRSATNRSRRAARGTGRPS